MKTKKIILALILLTFHLQAFAHCPTAYKPEGACMWLDKNMLFIYDHKSEHNGPYKDLEMASVTAIKNAKGDNLLFKKVARGIFKLEVAETQKAVTLVLTQDKKKTELKVKQD